MTINFLTFANTDFISLDRIKLQAESFNIFDKIFTLTEKDIPEIIEMHREFINFWKKGFGLYIWKPEIIVKTLEELEENDILIYADGGTFLNVNGKDRLNFYLQQLETHDIITFSSGPNYKSREFVKMDAIQSYYPQLINEDINACYASVMIIKKTNKSMHLLVDWLNLCRNYEFIDKFPSRYYKELPSFKGNDCDNGLFILCLAKHKIDYIINHEETNLYNSKGEQIHFEVAENEWEKLNNYPFQLRRLRPRD